MKRICWEIARKNGLSKETLGHIESEAHGFQAEGLSEKEANLKAVQDYIDSLVSERKAVVDQISAQSKDKSIGEGRNGPIYQDAKGVRYYVDGGARVTEKVPLVPTRDGLKVVSGKDRTDDFKTNEELAKEEEIKAKEQESISASLRAQKKREEDHRFDSLYQAVMSAPEGELQSIVDGMSEDDRAAIIARLDAAPGDNPAVRAAIAPYTKEETPKQEIKDVGENLWANRRNWTGKTVSWDSIKDLGETLRVKEVTKQKVWPKPDYEKLVEEGLPSFFARLIKHVYDGIASAPTDRSDAGLQRYISVVQRVRDETIAWAKDRDANMSLIHGAANYAKSMTGKTIALSEINHEAHNPRVLLDRIFAKGERFKRDTEALLEIRALGGNRALSNLQFTMEDLSDAMKEISAGWPAKREMWQIQGLSIKPSSDARIQEEKDYNKNITVYTAVIGTGRDEVWLGTHDTQGGAQAEIDSLKPFILVSKRGRVLGQFDTQEAATEAAKEAVKKSGGKRDMRGMNISSAERVGPDRRQGGEDISPDRLKDEFGFRGVNFGGEGWINQAERQEYLNHAYDSLIDLAEIMDVPTKALSLNGMLGIAFGAQGRGGHAAAHFIPGHNEINLTKTMGAGTLAHEWGHALDHYFAVKAGLSRKDDPFLSEHVRLIGEAVGDVRQEVADAFKVVVDAMNKRPMTKNEYKAQQESGKSGASKSLDKWISHMRKAAEKDEKVLSDFDKLADRLRKGDLGPLVNVKGQHLSEVVGDMKALIRGRGDKSAGVDIAENWKGLNNSADHVKYVLSRKEAEGSHVPQTTSTTYAKESYSKDKEKGGKKVYWSSNLEKFARAFETWVASQLEEKERSNTFLSDAHLRADAVDPETGKHMSPYPRDMERASINDAISTLVDSIESKETDKGVALFSTGTGRGMPKEDIDALVSSLERGWSNPPTVVVDSVKNAPKELLDEIKKGVGADGKPIANRVKGAYLDGVVYLFPENIHSVEDAQRTFLHEVRHRGFAGMFGDSRNRVMIDLYLSNKRLKSIVDAKIEASVSAGVSSKDISRVEVIEEALADMRIVPDAIMDRLVSWFRRMLRKLGWTNLTIGDSEVRELIRDAIRFSKNHGGFDVRTGPSFSVGQERNDELAKDQIAWLQSSALEHGYDSLDSFVQKDFSGFIEAGEKWRADHPNAAMFSIGAEHIPFQGSALKSASTLLNEHLQTDRVLNRVVSKANTPYHVALTHPESLPAYEEVQAFTFDISRIAISAAEIAHRLLPRVESVKDAMPASMGGRKYASHTDIAAMSEALFEGTLYGGASPMDGVKWTDAELRGQESFGRPLPKKFNLTDSQIDLYHQALDSVAHSLREFSKSLVWRLAGAKGIKLNSEMSLARMSGIARDMASQAIEGLRFGLETRRQADDDGISNRSGAEIQADVDGTEKQIKEMQGFSDSVSDIENKTEGLIGAGYFPLMRFGRYWVDVVRNGKRVYFARYDTNAEKNRDKAKLKSLYPDAEVTSGLLSLEEHKQFKGLNLDALEQFAQYMTDDKGDPIFKDALAQEFFRLAISERGTLKRNIHRKGMAGYSTDVPRALAQFNLSNARTSSSNYHGAAMLKHVAEIKPGDLKDYWERFRQYIQDPQEEAAMVRGFLANYYILGSLAFGAINLTQPVMVTAPVLTQYMPYSKAMSTLAKATKDIATGAKLNAEETALMDKARKMGITSPQEIHNLAAETRYSALGRQLWIKKLLFGWGAIYSLTEQFNRNSTFLAAIRVAKTLGKDPLKFGKEVVDESQFVYGKKNRPEIARGPVMSIITTFKQFTISYVELMKRLWDLKTPDGKSDRRAFAAMVLTMGVAAGIQGLPFAEDIEDIIDTIGQWLGFGTNSKKRVRELAWSILGKTMGDILLHGVSAIPGSPFDISNRLGAQNIFPGTSLMKLSEPDKTQEITQVLGPAAGLVKNAAGAFEGAMTGKPSALMKLAPKAVQDIYKGSQMLDTGKYKNSRGAVVTDVGPVDSMFKVIGLHPQKVASGTRISEEIQQDVQMHKVMEDSISEKWAQGIAEKDPSKIAEAKAMRDDWNKDNPELKIIIPIRQVVQRARNLLKTQDERQMKAIPREIRPAAKKLMQEAAE